MSQSELMEIDVKLGIDEVMTIMDSWYAQHKQNPIEMAKAVKNILQEPMDVNELESAADSAFWLEFGHETYQMSLSLSLPGLPTFQNFSDNPPVWNLWSHPLRTSCWTLQHHSPEPPVMEDQQDPFTWKFGQKITDHQENWSPKTEAASQVKEVFPDECL